MTKEPRKILNELCPEELKGSPYWDDMVTHALFQLNAYRKKKVLGLLPKEKENIKSIIDNISEGELRHKLIVDTNRVAFQRISSGVEIPALDYMTEAILTQIKQGIEKGFDDKLKSNASII